MHASPEAVEHVNHLGQPVGPPLPQWQVPPSPARETLAGRLCRLDPLDVDRHESDLWSVLSLDPEGRTWTYLPYGPFKSVQDFRGWLTGYCLGKDPLFYAIVEQTTGKPLGLASYLRINPSDGVIEVGHLIFSPGMQRQPLATEAMYLMMKQAFDLGYRRYEWKCDSLNGRSRAAAQRLGFRFEGIFRQDRVYKGRSRDTAWFSVIDREWPALENKFLQWLSADNFDQRGLQRTSLSVLTAELTG